MHLIIILDGFGYDVVKRHKDSGGFKDFNEPSKVVAPYPTLTDLCIQDLLQGESCEGMEAVYYDKEKGKMAGSTLSYLQFKNQPYSKILDFRSPSVIDAICYVAPWMAFEVELKALKKQLLNSKRESFKAYLVSTAGISTKYAAEGQTECLTRLDTFLRDLKAQISGSLMITLLSDHGHSYYASKLSPIKKLLKSKGWNFPKSLSGHKDAVHLSFGLVNYASFATLDAPQLAKDLATIPGVELSSYVEADSVNVFGANGSTARIRRSGQACSYETLDGDPLDLDPILKNIANQDGFYRDEDVQAVTVNRPYPSALERLWRAHFGLVKHPPDVIASLGNEWHSGSGLLNVFATVNSTHGSLNRTNSVTFAMSTKAAIPPVLRSREVMDFLI
ncbi:MAG: hypothetical protein WC551_03165 [Patescibacteria group bacterium]